MIEITEENYKGYVELYKTYYFSLEEQNKATKFAFLFSSPLVIPLIVLSLINAPSAIIISMLGLSILMPYCVGKSTLSRISKKKKENVSLLYSNIDVNIPKEQLEYALIKAKILRKTCQYDEIDISEYEQFLKCEKIKQQLFEENKYNVIFDNSITDEEMERVKVKTLIKK